MLSVDDLRAAVANPQRRLLLVLVGTPAAGKSHLARHGFADVATLASDELRGLIGAGEHDQSVTAEAFALLDQLAAILGASQRVLTIDSTAAQPFARQKLLELAAEQQREPIFCVVDTPLELARRRNRERGRQVPDDALVRIDQQVRAFVAAQDAGPAVLLDPVAVQDLVSVPLHAPACLRLDGDPPETGIGRLIDSVITDCAAGELLRAWARRNPESMAAILPALAATIDFDQRSPHHDRDCFTHILDVVGGVAPEQRDLRLAALFHDVGKPPAAWLTIDSPDGTRTHHCGSVPSPSLPEGARAVAHFYGARRWRRMVQELERRERPVPDALRAAARGHAAVGAELATRDLERLGFSAQRIATIRTLVRQHMFAPVVDHAGATRFLQHVLAAVDGDPAEAERISQLLLELRRADNAARPHAETDLERAAELIAQARRPTATIAVG